MNIKIQRQKFEIMGILNLGKVIGDNAPNAIKQSEIKNFFGKNSYL